MPRQLGRTLRLETLEDRNLLAAGILENGWIGVLGSKGSDQIEITMNSYGEVVVSDNYWVHYFSARPAIAIRALGGDDTITIDDSVTIPVIVEGGKGNDTIMLGSGNDAVKGGAGNDTISGGDGIDLIYGDAGNDSIWGGGGNDVMSGGTGADTIYGGEGDDMIAGDAGHDTIYGEWGDDAISGQAGSDLIDGGLGDDNLAGEAGNDFIYGGSDNDRIDGGLGKDFCQGNDGNDMLKGGAGVDHLDGGAGDNVLDNDTGKDIVTSGLVADLDQDLWASASAPGLGMFTAKFEVTNDHGAIKSQLTVRADGMAPNLVLNVVVNNVTVGYIATDSSGHSDAVFSSAPGGNELLLPNSFPPLGPGSTIAIGSTLHANLAPAFLVQRELVLPQLALIQ